MPDVELTPMLCEDNISVLMLSKGFKNESDAVKLMDSLLAGELEGMQLWVEKLSSGQLAGYSGSTDVQALLSESVLSVDGAKNTLPLFFADARFLTWLPDNSAALFAKNENGVERLYTADKTGVKHLITETGFATVIKAAYSENCQKLVFIEQALLCFPKLSR